MTSPASGTEAQRRAAARTVAARKLRERHPQDWNDLLGYELGERGIEWTPKPTQEEQAIADIRKILAENPGLDLNAIAQQQ